MTHQAMYLFERAANFKPHLFQTDLLTGTKSCADHY